MLSRAAFDESPRTTGRRVEVAADLGCVIPGNEEALRRALENIVRNAVRHTADGTKVEVSLRRERTRTIIRVRDHGPERPDNMPRSIFVPFRRAKNSADGSGLALAIAERAVVAHSGSLLASNPEAVARWWRWSCQQASTGVGATYVSRKTRSNSPGIHGLVLTRRIE